MPSTAALGLGPGQGENSMKRRDFLSAPVALVGLGLAVGGSQVARAAGVTSSVVPSKTTTTTTTGASFTVLRLVGSALETEAFGNWQAAWPQVPSSLSRARVVVHGYVRGTTNTLGAVNIESAFFGTDGKANQALVYAVSDLVIGSGSGAVGFNVQAPHFGGFVVTPAATASTSRQKQSAAPIVVTLGDANGRLAPGLYVMVLSNSSQQRLDASQFVYTGYNERPLVLRNGRAPDADYLAFSVEQP